MQMGGCGALQAAMPSVGRDEKLSPRLLPKPLVGARWAVVCGVLLCVGCGAGRKKGVAHSAEPTAQGVSAKTAEEAQHGAEQAGKERSVADLVRDLSRRDETGCAALERGLVEPVANWLEVIRTVEVPPWVPMRAVTCVIELHPVEIVDSAAIWLSSAQTPGFAILVLERLHLFDEGAARALAESAFEGPHRDMALKRLLASPSPTLKAMAESASSASE